MKRVLIAEDDNFLVRFITSRLSDEGFTVDSAKNGQEALDKLTQAEYDLVVTDLIMPELDGFGLLSEIGRMPRKVPVLVYSNLRQPQDEKEAMRLGAKAFLDKTNSLDSLIRLIEKHAN